MPDGHPRATDADAIRRAVRAGPVAMPGVHDGLSARLAADAGFGVLFVSGFAVAATRLAAPDLGYVALADMAEVTRWVARVAGGPVVVDADTGYGNAANARHTVETLVAAGAAGVFLEDQEWPKRCGHFAGKRVVAREDWLAKLRAVVDWREETSRDVYLVARTDARAAIGLEEASIGVAPPAPWGSTPCSSRRPSASTRWRPSRRGCPASRWSRTWSRAVARHCSRRRSSHASGSDSA